MRLNILILPNTDEVSTTITDNLIGLTKTVTVVDNDGDSTSDSATIDISEVTLALEMMVQVLQSILHQLHRKTFL